MLWIFALLLVLACIGVLFAGLRRASAQPASVQGSDASRAFFRDQLEGIDRDVAGGRLSEAEAIAAKAELAREIMRIEKQGRAPAGGSGARLAFLAILPVIAIASFGVYGLIGRSDLPAQPFADREPMAQAGEISLADAVARVEAQMAATPNDPRGWMVLAPIYMEQGRYEEAANAWRRVLSLEPPTADRETNLAEALIMASGGDAPPEALDLLASAIDADPVHIRSRFYLAGQLTQSGQYREAIALWQQLLGLATGEEAWIATARAGLAAAEAGLASTTLSDSEPDATMGVMIRGMVDGLAARLYSEGGSVEEWIQLVRSRDQLDGAEAARADLERGLAALSGNDRIALENFGRELELGTEQ